MSGDLTGLHPTLAHHLVSTLGWTELRPLQQAAIAPVLADKDVLLLAPTAGGKTEAATFPVLSRMAAEGWTGLSAIYLCPLKALLNNLLPRLETYGGWTGRRVALWHGDTQASRRKSILADPPDVLLHGAAELAVLAHVVPAWHGDLQEREAGPQLRDPL